MTTLLLTLAGVALILITLRDVVHELFNPEMSGTVSSFVARSIWRAMRVAARWRRGAIRQAGPTMLVAIGATWVIGIGVGSALIYVPRLPQDFDIGPGVPASSRHGLMTAIYLSGVVMTSVGSGDVSPKMPGVRMMAVVEPVLGLVLISAWITWVLSLYPIVAKRRAFEREVVLLRRATGAASFLSDWPREAVPEMLRTLTTQVVAVATDLGQSEISYYFQNEEPQLALASQLPYVLTLARAAEEPGREPLVRHYGTRLRLATESLLDDVGRRYLRMRETPPDEVLRALAHDQLIPDSPADANKTRALPYRVSWKPWARTSGTPSACSSPAAVSPPSPCCRSRSASAPTRPFSRSSMRFC